MAGTDRAVDVGAGAGAAGVLRTGAGGGVGTTKTGFGVGFEKADEVTGWRAIGLGAKLVAALRQGPSPLCACLVKVPVLAAAAVVAAALADVAAGRFVVDLEEDVTEAWLGGRLCPGVPDGLERGEDPISAPELEATRLELPVPVPAPVELGREGAEGDL